MKRLLIPVAFAIALSVYANAAPSSSSSRLNPPSRLKPPSSRLRPSSSTTRAPRGEAANLCHNGSLDHEGNPLDGWMVDYAWSGHSTYSSNKSRIKALSSYSGKSGVLYVDGRRGETKVECLPIPYEHGARYRCTIDYKATCGPHIYFAGYKWKPGVRPYRDKPVHIGDLRKIYKSQFRNHKISTTAGGWKRDTFEFPLENASELSLKHLKYLRFITVYFMVINDGPGEAWIDNVVVTRIE